MTAASELSVRFGRLERRGVLLGLSAAQVALVAGGRRCEKALVAGINYVKARGLRLHARRGAGFTQATLASSPARG